MWKLTLNYDNLNNPQDIYVAINKHSSEFDWTWADADWAKNFEATQKVIADIIEENSQSIWIRLWAVTDERWEKHRCVFYYEQRMSSFIDVTTEEGIEQMFDFSSPLDVLNVLDDLEWRAKEVEAFYQIKVS